MVPVIMKTVTLVVTLTACLGLPQDKIVFPENEPDSDTCKSPNGAPGQCVRIDNCDQLVSLIQDPSKREFLDQSLCGWEGNIQKVCCEEETSKSAASCKTANNEPGHCISINDCIPVKSMLVNPTEETIKSIKSLRCGTGKFDVCCRTGRQPTFEYKTTDDQCVPQSTPSNSSSQCCGQRRGLEDRIMQGEVASIDQFPWVAAIEYENVDATELKCGGSLISGRYVLSAAHCFYFFWRRPINVRLGEFNTETEGPDCVAMNDGSLQCTYGDVTIPIEHIVIHPQYNSDSPSRTHDIALIRLAKSAPYTDFIRPICLPTSDLTESMDVTTNLVAAGWGIYDETQVYSTLLRYVSLPYVKIEDCFLIYLGKNAILGDGQFCAGGAGGRDTCEGDSGSALILDRPTFSEVVGVTSFGFTDCGIKKRPAVYTKVYHYLPWIRDNIY